MDFSWFFRRRFGDHQRPPFSYDDDGHDPESNHRNEESTKSSDISLMDPFESFEATSHDIFHHMDDMFNRMFSLTFGPLDFPKVGEMIPNDSKIGDMIPNDVNPRDIMLKDAESDDIKLPFHLAPFEEKQQPALIDTDIDDQVEKHGLFLNKRFEKGSIPQNFTFKKFSSVRTVRLPDGTMEESRTFTDSEGNQITTVKRSLGDQSYEVTTRKDGQGLKEKQENFTNMDENDISEFEKRWENIKSRKVLPPTTASPSEPGAPFLSPPLGDPSYLSLFKRFFGF